MFLVSEVNPFDDGNGSVARVMTNSVSLGLRYRVDPDRALVASELVICPRGSSLRRIAYTSIPVGNPSAGRANVGLSAADTAPVRGAVSALSAAYPPSAQCRTAWRCPTRV